MHRSLHEPYPPELYELGKRTFLWGFSPEFDTFHPWHEVVGCDPDLSGGAVALRLTPVPLGSAFDSPFDVRVSLSRVFHPGRDVENASTVNGAAVYDEFHSLFFLTAVTGSI